MHKLYHRAFLGPRVPIVRESYAHIIEGEASKTGHLNNSIAIGAGKKSARGNLLGSEGDVILC